MPRMQLAEEKRTTIGPRRWVVQCIATGMYLEKGAHWTSPLEEARTFTRKGDAKLGLQAVRSFDRTLGRYVYAAGKFRIIPVRCVLDGEGEEYEIEES